MFSVLLLLVTTPFGLVTPDSTPLSKGCSILPRKVDARRSLFTTKQEIDLHWSQPNEPSISKQEHLVKYGSLARKSTGFKEGFDRKEETQKMEGIQENDERRKGLNGTALGSEESAQDLLESDKRKGKQKQNEFGCSVLMRGSLDNNSAVIDITCTTVDEISVIRTPISDIKDSKSIPDMTSNGFKIFDEVDGELYAIHVNPNASLVLTNVNISNFKGLGSIFLVSGTGLDIRRGMIFDIFESQHSGVMSVTNSTVKVSNCVFKNTHGRHTGFATIANSTFDLRNSNFEDNFGLEESLIFFAKNSSKLNLINDTVVGTLPKTDDETTLLPSTTRAWKNFKVVQARAGVAYLTDASTLTIQSSHLMHVGSMKGLIYLEKNSSLLCKDSFLIHNIAIYGGAIFAQDSIVNVSNVHAERNAASRGGAILFRGASTGFLDSVVFRSNLASEGGAFYIEYDDCGLPDTQYLMSIKNCLFIGNRAYYEGGAVFTSCVSLDVAQSSFISNTAWLGGGGIFANASFDINLKQVNFSGNTALEGGAIAVHADMTRGNMTVDRGRFTGNQAKRGSGGAIMYHGLFSTLKFESNKFSSNEAANDGGAIFASRTLELDISSDEFTNNHANNGSGGSIHVFRNIALILSSSSISGSNATDDGGGLYVYKSKSFKLKSSQVQRNGANKGDGGGIALFCVGNITMEDATVKGNIAGSSGGGMSYKIPQYIPDDERNDTCLSVNLSSSLFQSNQASDGGGLFVHSIDVLTLIRSHFVSNTAISDGGGILIRSVTSVSLQRSNMRENEAQKGRGGALYAAQMSKFNVSVSMFEENIGYLSGGALCLLESPILILEKTWFFKNEATAYSGGAIALFDDTKIVMKDTHFQNNTAKKSGGAIYARQPQQAEIEDSQFESNIAKTGNGGGICFLFTDSKLNTTSYNASQPVNSTVEETSPSSEDLPPSISMSRTRFTHNEAGYHGGGLYLNKLRGTLTLDINPTFENCKAIGGSGGCAYLSNIAEFLVVRGHLVDNTAHLNGGCFALMNIPRVDLNESKFISCGATKGKGGAVYYHGDPETNNTLMLDSIGPSNCRAAKGGACHISNVEVLFLDGSNFYEGKARDGSGGCLVANNVMEVHMRNVRVAESEASGSCGGICLKRVAYLILDGTFNNNRAGLHGGGAWLRDVTRAIITESYSGNRAGKYGGALFLTNVSDAEIRSVAFTGNHAGGEGGAVSVYLASTMKLIESNFARNDARDGGGLHIGFSDQEQDSFVKVLKCRFLENEAHVNGGGVSINKRNLGSLNSITPSQPGPGSVEVSNSLFEHNKADNGGGMEVVAGDVRVEHNTFLKNEASGSGGAFYVNDPDFLHINNATIERNTAHKGGALSVGCESNMNLTNAVIRRNSAPRRDDGGLIACEKANISTSNVKFFHNFRDQEWYFYVLFPLCSYSLLLAFLLIGVFIFQWYYQQKKRTVTYDTYSDIGEYDPSAVDLSSFLAEPVAEVESDDEGIVAPKPSPGDAEAKSGHAISQIDSRRTDPEISEDSEEDAPIPQHRYPSSQV